MGAQKQVALGDNPGLSSTTLAKLSSGAAGPLPAVRDAATSLHALCPTGESAEQKETNTSAIYSVFPPDVQHAQSETCRLENLSCSVQPPGSATTWGQSRLRKVGTR